MPGCIPLQLFWPGMNYEKVEQCNFKILQG